MSKCGNLEKELPTVYHTNAEYNMEAAFYSRDQQLETNGPKTSSWPLNCQPQQQC